MDLVLPVGFEPTTGRLEAVCSDSTELRKRMVDGRVVQEKATTLSKGVISHWLSVFKPAIQDYLESFFSSTVRLQGSWNMPYLSMKEERN